MATVNQRLRIPQGITINAVDAGGAMSVNIQAGYGNVLLSSPDGLAVPVKDKEKQFVRGTIVSQDWVKILDLLTGTSGTFVFYQKKSKGDDTTGFVKHTLNNPVINEVELRFATDEKSRYAIITAKFECQAADETKTITDMWTVTDAQAKPAYISAARGGYRIVSATHGTGGTQLSILHILGLRLALRMPLNKRCNDADLAYTTVEAVEDGMICDGDLQFEDSTIDTSLLCQRLLIADKGDLVLTVKQGQGAANKTLTIASVDFDTLGANGSVQNDYDNNQINFSVANTAGAPLTLAGTNKIIVIA